MVAGGGDRDYNSSMKFNQFLPSIISVLLVMSGLAVWGQPSPAAKPNAMDAATAEAEAKAFGERIQPLLATYCVRCHNADNMKSGVRVDQLTGTPEDQHLPLWKAILEQVGDEAMPPPDEAQPTADQRSLLVDWIRQALVTAKTRNRQRNGSARRLTVAQYRNTLRDLLGLDEDLTESLPPDAVSKEGFTNHDKTLFLSPLQVETYIDVATQAVDLCIVDVDVPPIVQTFRVDLGAAINAHPCPDKLILGANSELLNNQDFEVTELAPAKPFAYQPFAMRTRYDFIEGYAGNDTVRGWRTFDSIYHAVFACVRGTPGYPKGAAYEVVPQGLLLRPAIPSAEVFGRSNTYGPMANFKISLRELPAHGNFRVTVKGARYRDGQLLDADARPLPAGTGVGVDFADPAAPLDTTVMIPADGIYQIDASVLPGAAPGTLQLDLDGRHLSGRLFERKVSSTPTNSSEGPPSSQAIPFLLVRLAAGTHPLRVGYSDRPRLSRIVIGRIPDDDPLAIQFTRFERRSPSIGVHLGLRRDCGSTLTQVGLPQPVSSAEIQDFVFEGAINDYPSPDVEQDNVNYLAGVREIGVRCEYTDGRDMPRLLIRSVQFEGPYYTQWPPLTHQNIFIPSTHLHEPAVYAREILQSFASRAFRRPVTEEELSGFLAVWQESQAVKADFRQAIKDALVVILTSPQFLFLIENSKTPEPEDLGPFELASKLSYFLWNTAPDRKLLERAQNNQLHTSLDEEVNRLVQDPRFGQFVREFASQWLNLDKFDVVSLDGERFPRLTRDLKPQLREEPIQFLQYVMLENLPLRNLVHSDFIVVNEAVADYYQLGDRVESGFRFVPLQHSTAHLGGVLTQASILSGLSDGREANPVKRGAWLARKIIAEPPADPPPNVPQIPKDDSSHLTLRQKLERHRNQEGCAKCHSGIDPWGLPFEQFNAAGIFRSEPGLDARSKLPDGTEVVDLNGLKMYLAERKLDQVAFSFLKHVATYAVGRSLSYHELEFLREEGKKLRSHDYRVLDMIRFVIKSDVFLKK